MNLFVVEIQKYNMREVCNIFVFTFEGGVQQTTQSSGSSCGEGYFTCETSRRCIVNQWLCDNERDCLDGSDEHGCGKLYHYSFILK